MIAASMPNTRCPNLRLVGATVLRDGTMQNRTVAIAAGKIAGGPYPVVDLSGYYIMPGIIDMHGDTLERHSAPIEAGLRVVDRDAAANGVTTAWLTQSWSWEGGRRGPDFAEQVMAALADYRRHALIDLRLQIRYETHAVDSAERLLIAIRQFETRYVVFNNHLDATIAAWADDPHAVECRAKRSGLTGAELMQIVHAALARSRDVPRSLCRLAEAFDTMGVLYGSHGDPDGETRELFSALGARICAFPAAFPAASVARALGEPVVMGAPNCVQGGAGCGGVSATALIRAGKCDALVSQDCYPSLAQAAFALVDQGIMDLPRAWAMISTTPARIMRLTDRGEIAPGKRADLVIVDKANRAVEGTIVAGRIVYLSGDAAQRFLNTQGSLDMAAE